MSIEGIRIEEVNKKVAQYWRVSVTEETTSTQGVLAAEHSITNVLLAEYQSAGRGRLDRSFIVPPRKGLTFSFYLPATNDFGWIPLITGLAVADAINNYIKSDIVTIKWPNDLQINGKKLAGILAEKISDGVVVGVGINIFQNKD